jgi:hypothetical protein
MRCVAVELQLDRRDLTYAAELERSTFRVDRRGLT